MIIALLLSQAVMGSPEGISAAAPKGFRSGYKAQQGGMTIDERVPEGETVEDWTRMVTVQKFPGIATRISAPAFLGRLAGSFAGSCSKSSIGEFVNEGTTSSVRVDCSLNLATGKPEVMLAKAFTGTTDLFMVQYAFRSIPTPSQAAEAERYIRSVSKCGGTLPACASK